MGDEPVETDISVKMAGKILPIIVYLPITIFVVLMGSFFGVKIYTYMKESGGISAFLQKNIRKIFGIKDGINAFIKNTVNTFWPDKDTIDTGDKSWKHVRLDSAIILTGSLFLLTMIVLYNYDYIKSLLFSKIHTSVRNAKNKIQNSSHTITKSGALISVGRTGKSRGEIIKIYTNENNTAQLFYYTEDPPIGKVETGYVSCPDNKPVADISAQQHYYLFDVKMDDGKIMKKFNNKQLEMVSLDKKLFDGKRDILYNDDGETTSTNNPTLSTSTTPSTDLLGQNVLIDTRKNVYDHNVFNVYDTNKRIDFNSKNLSFVDKSTGKSSTEIENWDVKLYIPEKDNIMLVKWGFNGIKKGVYSLATNGKHSGFTLGIKGNGADENDPLNNYIFKDKSGKTYRAKLENYGIKKYGPKAYVPGFSIVYKIRKKRQSYDVSIYINDKFVMEIKNGGVPLNDIKWCGDKPDRHESEINKKEQEKKYRSKNGQYYRTTDITCDGVGEIEHKHEGEGYCLKTCKKDQYNNLFTRECSACPPGTKHGPVTKDNPLFADCKSECKEGQIWNGELSKCINIENKKDLINKVAGWGNTQEKGSYHPLTSEMDELSKNATNFNVNESFVKLLGSVGKIQEIIDQGGYPVNGNNIRKPENMPTLTVYQVSITENNPNKRIHELKKDESGFADKILNSIAPFLWFKIKRNVGNNTPEVSSRGVAKRNSTLIGGVALLFGFVIFTSLLVTQFNQEILQADPTALKDVFIDKASYYMYSLVFVGIALFLFAALLFYAATSDAGSKFLSTLLIILSAVIILAAIAVIFRAKIESFIKGNPYIRFMYHALFVIPCLFIDLVNYVYYEFKTSPKSVFIVFAIEISIILSVLLIPAIRNRFYLYIKNDKDSKTNVNIKVEILKRQKINLEIGIHKIKTFNPSKDTLTLIKLNSKNDVIYNKLTKNKQGVLEEEHSENDKDVFGFIKKKVGDKIVEFKKLFKTINPLQSSPVISAGLDSDAWEVIKGKQLDHPTNISDLNKLLMTFGYKSIDECDKILSKKKSSECKEAIYTMATHIQMNARNILLFTTIIKDIDNEIKELKKIKTSNLLQKGTVILNEPMYFRSRKSIPITDINKNQFEKMKYNYAISCWFFVHSQSPNYSSEYNKETPIISYNGEPTIYYSGKTNELVIRTKQRKRNPQNTLFSINELTDIEQNIEQLRKDLKDVKELKEKATKESENSLLPILFDDTQQIKDMEKNYQK